MLYISSEVKNLHLFLKLIIVVEKNHKTFENEKQLYKYVQCNYKAFISLNLDWCVARVRKSFHFRRRVPE